MTFEYITMNTGHRTTKERRDAISAAIWDIKPLVENIIEPLPTNYRFPRTRGVPGVTGYKVSCARTAKARCPIFTIYERGGPLVDFGVACVDGEAAAYLWDSLHRLARDVQLDADLAPVAPWCAVVMHAELLLRTEDQATILGLLEDFECRVTWAMLDILNRA